MRHRGPRSGRIDWATLGWSFLGVAAIVAVVLVVLWVIAAAVAWVGS